MTLSQERLEELFDCSFRYYDSVDSTNDIAMQWLRDGAESGSVVIADEQRKGRGRKGRFWHTPTGVALAISVILKPEQSQAHRVSMIGALAVYDLCVEFGAKDVGIKWPNDVQINGKKISGILPEAAWENDRLHGVILGMGVNVRVRFVDEIADTAINLEDAVGKPLNRSELVGILMQRINYWVGRMGDDELFDTWSARLNTIGQRVEVEGIVGQAQAVDVSGALLIKVADGSIKTMMAGDVSLLPSQDKGSAHGC